MSKNMQALLRWYQDNGCEYLFEESPSATLSDSASNIQIITPSNKINSNAYESTTIADNCNDLSSLVEAIKNFNGCEIKKSANSTVISDGDPKAKVMLIGEAPGANEDKEGIPFCGQSGKLLNNIIKSIGLNRGEVYITNTVFWRPPGNRRPTPNEISLCRPFVEKHISLINPELIILVGSTAVESLLSIDTPITSMRQKLFEYHNKYMNKSIPCVVIYHPSYLLRQPYKKKEMWYDMQYIKHTFLTQK